MTIWPDEDREEGGKIMLSERMQQIWDEFSDEEKEAIQARYEELRDEYLTLQELRKRKHVTQKDLAELLGINQENVSRMERRKDLRLSTIREYVEALGGHIQIRAVFPHDEGVIIFNSDHEDDF